MAKKTPAEPAPLVNMNNLPPEVLATIESGKIESFEQLLGFELSLLHALLSGAIPVRMSAEVRNWITLIAGTVALTEAKKKPQGQLTGIRALFIEATHGAPAEGGFLGDSLEANGHLPPKPRVFEHPVVPALTDETDF